MRPKAFGSRGFADISVHPPFQLNVPIKRKNGSTCKDEGSSVPTSVSCSATGRVTRRRDKLTGRGRSAGLDGEDHPAARNDTTVPRRAAGGGVTWLTDDPSM